MSRSSCILHCSCCCTATADYPDIWNPVNYRDISNIHSGAGRSELSFCGIILLIKRAVDYAVTWEQHVNTPPKSLHFGFKLETLIFSHTLPQILDSSRRTDQEQNWWKAALSTLRNAHLAFLFPAPVFPSGVVTQWLGSGSACRLRCCNQTNKQRLLAFTVKACFLLFPNTAYSALCLDDIWLTPVHWKAQKWW